MKRLFNKFAVWYHIHVSPLEDRGVIPRLYKVFNKLQSLLGGPAHIILNGNSVVAAGMPLFQRIQGLRVIAVPGLKLHGIRGLMFALAAKLPLEKYLFDGVGNDFIENADPDAMFEELKTAVAEARQALGHACVVYWINIVPPGPMWPLLAAKIAAFNERVRLAGFVRILDIHSRLSGGGVFCKAEYSEKDGIHNTPVAYIEQWFPMIEEACK